MSVSKDAVPSPYSDASDSEVRLLKVASAEVNKVGVRIPPFSPDDPELWFSQIEYQFTLSGISSDTTKFYYVTGQLEPQYAKEVRDIIISPPASNKFPKLKSELIKRLSSSNEKKVKQLLMHEELGDRRPSQFYRHLQGLAGANVPDEFLKSIWSNRLPRNIQSFIAAQFDSPIDVLMDLADRVQDIAPSTPQVAAMSSSMPGSSMDAMAREIAELRKQMHDLTTHFQRQSRPRTQSRGRQRSRSSSRTRTASEHRRFPVCWYHHKFGEKARCCVKPCDYESENL